MYSAGALLLLLCLRLIMCTTDCNYYPFFSRPQWRNFAQDCRLTQDIINETDSYLRVELPERMEDYLNMNQDSVDECLEAAHANGGYLCENPFRQFDIVARLDNEDGQQESQGAMRCFIQDLGLVLVAFRTNQGPRLHCLTKPSDISHLTKFSPRAIAVYKLKSSSCCCYCCSSSCDTLEIDYYRWLT